MQILKTKERRVVFNPCKVAHSAQVIIISCCFVIMRQVINSHQNKDYVHK